MGASLLALAKFIYYVFTSSFHLREHVISSCDHNPINKPAKNNKRMLIAAVFHFVVRCKKTGKSITR